jgi:putative nucleotidyltransferase with HDIG domain
MTRKRILFVGEDLELWEELRNLQLSGRAQWDYAFAKTGLQALNSLTQSPCDAVIADMQMPGMNGAQLLDELMQRNPATLRFIRANLSDQQAAMKCVGTAHQYLVKPSDASTVHSALARAFNLESWLPGEAVQKLISQMRKLPSPPNLYFQIVAELQSPDSSLEKVGSLITQDVGLSAKLLQVVNSAVFGLQMQVVKPVDAVLYLGMETTKSLVLLAHTFSYFDKVRTANFSVDRLWRHSVTTGKYSERIARAENVSIEVLGQSFTAGILHDIGKLLLAANMPEEFKQILTRANTEKIPMCDAETAVIGVPHAELGACLLGIWGLPTAIVEAVALHHHPARFFSKTFCPLTAVHAANSIEHELNTQANGMTVQAVDLNYLTELGLEERYASWRDLCAERVL